MDLRNLQSFGTYDPQNPGLFLVFILLMIWSIVWKGIALYRSARNEHKVWFVILLVANTVGILEIIYLSFFTNAAKKKKK